MLENALVAGITSLGVDVLVIGPLPTPGVAYITRSLRADAGIVLSASHNPYEDNGIKFFRHDGYKLDDEIEQQIEQLVFSGEIDSIRPDRGKDRPRDAHRRCARALRRVREGQFPARHVARENAHRGRCRERRGLQIDAVHSARTRRRPDRRSRRAERDEHQRAMRQHLSRRKFSASCKESGAQVGITHDGDADRVLLCDENGELVDGDEILAIAAVDLLQIGPARRRTRSSPRS